MSQQAKNEFYKDEEEMAMDFAAAVNAEARDLQKAGADVIQLDEPWVRNNPERGPALRGEGDQPRARRASRCRPWSISASAMPRWCRVDKPTGYSFLPQLADTVARADFDRGGAAEARSRRAADLSAKKIMLGVLDLGDPEIETTEIVAERIRNGLKYVAAER